jgi:hypothetical protein
MAHDPVLTPKEAQDAYILGLSEKRDTPEALKWVARIQHSRSMSFAKLQIDIVASELIPGTSAMAAIGLVRDRFNDGDRQVPLNHPVAEPESDLSATAQTVADAIIQGAFGKLSTSEMRAVATTLLNHASAQPQSAEHTDALWMDREEAKRSGL